jgi:DNA-binding GntR family transcriptional regulator
MNRRSIARHPRLGEEVTHKLRTMIVHGQLRPGERLVEERLSSMLGISRTPLREALHRLEQKGMLSKRTRGGYVVRPLTYQEVEEAVDVRAVLEAFAAERAAKRRSPVLLERLKENADRFEKAFLERNERELLRLNSTFHALVHEMAESMFLFRLLAELNEVVERTTAALASSLAAGSWSVDDHRALIHAIDEGDPDTAARLAREHVRQGGSWILERMRSENLEL